MTRIRPGHKNDHGRIEQKNYSNVRKITGYIRIETEEKIKILEELYLVFEDYVNHFIPSAKCIDKRRIGSKYRRIYDRSQTAYERVLSHKDISAEIKEKLKAKHDSLNPKILKEKIDKLRRELFK